MITLPTQLTAEDVVSIAKGARVQVSAQARKNIEAHYETANRIAEQQPVYGRSTGVGANRTASAAADPETHGMNLLRSHAVDAGPAVGEERTRAMLAVRLNQLLYPGSGIAPSVIDGLERMLSANALPEIRRYGGIGTGDLPALASTALALAGERPTSATFEPIGPIRSDSALPFMSSSAFTLGGAALISARLARVVNAAIAAFVLSAWAIQANPSAFSRQAATAVASPDSAENAALIAALLGDTAWDPARIQDPFAFRGFLPIISVLSSSVHRLSQATETLMNSAQENPRFFEESGSAVHHGAFFEAWLAHELDATAMGLAQSAPMVLARLRFLNDDAFTGLPRFLAPSRGGSSGTMVLEYLAASAMGEVLVGATPASTHSAVLSCGVEEDATFAPTALGKLERAVEGYEVMVAAEIVTAVRALRLKGVTDAAESQALAALMELVRQLPSGAEDRDLRVDMDAARTLIPAFARVVSGLAADVLPAD
ncbi:aromatic amino acid lyase [Leucobacter viscericola]|uniref:Aromatic amino acid lyase n=1 Tax=Leucobacter viscericola TaxID=2714935 RepID=A0A6G7XE07_9MICO|nr:aromatic amino acid ammonia-lyase [Leucobacter viscericola]QIK62742.1 aromatic amino acid lyase [Leucobacter viscericola]